MYLITGSTGHIGRPLVERLHKEGHEVRALVRNLSRAELLPSGIDIAIGNLDDDVVAGASTVVTTAGETVEGGGELDAGVVGPELVGGGWQPNERDESGTTRAPGWVVWTTTKVPMTVVPSLSYAGTEMSVPPKALSQARASAGERTVSRPEAQLSHWLLRSPGARGL